MIKIVSGLLKDEMEKILNKKQMYTMDEDTKSIPVLINLVAEATVLIAVGTAREKEAMFMETREFLKENLQYVTFSYAGDYVVVRVTDNNSTMVVNFSPLIENYHKVFKAYVYYTNTNEYKMYNDRIKLISDLDSRISEETYIQICSGHYNVIQYSKGMRRVKKDS